MNKPEVALNWDIKAIYTSQRLTDQERVMIHPKLVKLAAGRTTVDFYQSLGYDNRHQLSNLKSLINNMRFGYDAVEFNSSGWLVTPPWVKREPLIFGTSLDNEGVKIDLGMGQNGKWSWGKSIIFGNGSGMHSGASTCSDAYATKDLAISDAILECKKRITDTITLEMAAEVKNPLCQNLPHLTNLLQQLTNYTASKMQLSIF